MSDKYHDLARILTDRYGVGPIAADPITIIWAVDQLAQEVGQDEAERQLSALNKRRTAMGKTVASRYWF